jgi:hypothetical protein
LKWSVLSHQSKKRWWLILFRTNKRCCRSSRRGRSRVRAAMSSAPLGKLSPTRKKSAETSWLPSNLKNRQFTVRFGRGRLVSLGERPGRPSHKISRPWRRLVNRRGRCLSSTAPFCHRASRRRSRSPAPPSNKSHSR